MHTQKTSKSRLSSILGRAEKFDPVTTFPTVDELLSDFDDRAEREPEVHKRRIGTSRLGEAIHEFIIGDGPRHVIVVGGVHPNEPIGFHTVARLADSLVDDPSTAMGLTWHIVPCIDPDGTRLNEGWFSDPSQRTHYARHFYRPAPDEQIEWSFPFTYKRAHFDAVIPETFALMRLIDETSPILLVGLHNAELGGVYYYLNRQLAGAVDSLHAIPAHFGLPLEAGEPESADSHAYGEAVYHAPLSLERYDDLEKQGLDPVTIIGGGSTADYVTRHGSLTFVAELPYWTHPESQDIAPSGRSYADVLEEKAAGLRGLGEELQRIFDAAAPDLHQDTPFLRASHAFVPLMSEAGDAEARRAAAPESHREATVAEVFTNDDLVRCFRLRYGGMLLRALNAEVCAGTAHPRLRRLCNDFERTYESWLAEADSVGDLTTLPIEQLVGVQFASTLEIAALLVDENDQ